MTNYKLYTIIVKTYPISSCVRFDLNDYVTYTGGEYKVVDCLNIYPFNTYQVGDHIEIDNDRTCFFTDHTHSLGSDIVRKVSSSEVARRGSNASLINQNQASETMIQVLNRAIDSDPRNKYTASVEVDPKTGNINYHLSGQRK